MAEIRRSGTWGSALSTDEFTSIRSVGFEPVGQVLGAAVYNIGYTGGYGCAGAWTGYYGNSFGPTRSVTQVSSRGGATSFAPLVQAMYDARHAAINRMTAECTELGGHGVVGVQAVHRPLPGGRPGVQGDRDRGARPRRAAPEATVHLRPVRAGFCQADHARLGAGWRSRSASRSRPGTTTG